MPNGPGTGRIRVRLEPSGDIDEFLKRLGEIQYRLGFPKARGGFYRARRSGTPPARLAPAGRRRSRSTRSSTSGTWTRRPRTVFDVLADGHTYPEWWKPVYIGVKTEGEYTLQHFKGRLPTTCTRAPRRSNRDRPYRLQGETDGDLRGTGIWTLSANANGTHVRFDWHVHADRRLLKLLTPILRPALRWNHNWAIARAIEGSSPTSRNELRSPPERNPGNKALDQAKVAFTTHAYAHDPKHESYGLEAAERLDLDPAPSSRPSSPRSTASSRSPSSRSRPSST